MPVKVIAGCIAIGAGADGGGRLEHGEAVPAGGVARRTGPRGWRRLPTSMVTTLASMSSGTVSSSRSQARATAVGLRDAGRRAAGSRCGAGGVGLAGGGHDLVAGGAERGGQDGADATGADNARLRRGMRHVVEPFVPVPPTTPLARRAGVGTGRCVLVNDQR